MPFRRQNIPTMARWCISIKPHNLTWSYLYPCGKRYQRRADYRSLQVVYRFLVKFEDVDKRKVLH